MNKKRNLLYLLFTLFSALQYFIRVKDIMYFKDGIWYISSKINGEEIFNFRNSLSTAYFLDKEVTVILILTYVIGAYNILKYNRYKVLLLIAYYCLFFIGQGYLWFRIKPFNNRIFEPYNYWLYGISIVGFLAVTYLYFVVDKKVFKQNVAWVKEQLKMTS